jgi:CRISPR-associated protein Csy2
MLTRLEHGESLFDQYALLRNEFSKALDKLVDNYAELAIKQRRQARLASLKQVRQSLIAWVAPLIEGRNAVEENDVDIKVGLLNQGGIEGQLLNSPYSEWESLLSLLFSHLNLLLSNSNKTRKYAYHPDLMKPLKSQLLWILKQLSRCPTEVIDAQPLQRYLHLKNINVYDAQLLSNPYCFGLPSLTAVWGMMHNYQRKLNEMLGTTIRFTSFAWFISQCEYTKGTQLPEFTMQGRKESEFRRPGIIDKRNGDLVFDLVIHIDGYEDDLAKLDNNTAKLKACFPSRFAGGTMHGPSVNADDEWCKLYENEDLLYSILRRSPAHGKWVMPTKYSIHSVRELTLLLENNMSLCPVMAGYMLLEKPKSRVGSIAPLHSYGEPVIGLASCDSAIDIRLQGQLNFYRRAFWFLEAKEQFLLMKRI